MDSVEKPKVFISQQEKAPEGGAPDAATETMMNGLRDDYCELKEEVRAKLKPRINDSAAVREYMIIFLNKVQSVRGAEYEKRVTSAVYESAVMELSKIFENIEKIPAAVQ